jgi:hypothetical protein
MTWLDEIERRWHAATPGRWSRVMALGSRWWTLGQIRSHTASPLTDDADWTFAEHAPEDTRRLLAVARAAERFADSAGVHWDGETPVLEIEVEAAAWVALKEALEGE